VFTLKPGYTLIYFARKVPYLHLFLLLLHKLLLLFYRVLHLHNSIWGMLLIEVNCVGVTVGSCTLNSRYYQIRLRRSRVRVRDISERVICQVECCLWIVWHLKLLHLYVWIVSLQSNILLAFLIDCLVMIEAGVRVGASQLSGHSRQRYGLNSCLLGPVRRCLIVNVIYYWLFHLVFLLHRAMCSLVVKHILVEISGLLCLVTRRMWKNWLWSSIMKIVDRVEVYEMILIIWLLKPIWNQLMLLLFWHSLLKLESIVSWYNHLSVIILHTIKTIIRTE
jgi:hypothetical protein